MEFEFLNHFEQRMKSVGAYALLYKNSMQKGTWKQYGVETFHEQTNLIFAVLLYIMEQSLKDEYCTMDDIGGYIDTINVRYFKKPLSYEDCKALGEFIVNVILCDEGKAMYFSGFDFNEGIYKDMHISFIANEVVYIDNEVRRTSYYLTETGYSMLLSTLEVESNMKLTIQEMIFKLHLEKATYDKAVDDIKNIFKSLRIQIKKMEEAMRHIRQNALSYSVQDYKALLEENLSALTHTKHKFERHKQVVAERIKELEEQDINIKKLEKTDRDNLIHLKTIESYLARTLDEHQRILLSHFDLKSLYTKELEDISQMSLIKRFNIRTELYNKILEQVSYLEQAQWFLGPLFNRPLEKSYNLNKALQFQKPIRSKQMEDEGEILTFDEEAWQEEQTQRLREKLLKYKNCLKVILNLACEEGGISLRELKEKVENRGLMLELVPTVEIFREVVIEMLKIRSIDVDVLRQEKESYLTDELLTFQLNECVLELVREEILLSAIKEVKAYKIEEEETVIFENLTSETGTIKRVICTNVYFEIIVDK